MSLEGFIMMQSLLGVLLISLLLLLLIGVVANILFRER